MQLQMLKPDEMRNYFLLIAELNVKFHLTLDIKVRIQFLCKMRKLHEIKKTKAKSGQWLFDTELHRCRSQCSALT